MKRHSCLISTLDGSIWSDLPLPGLTSGKKPATPVIYSRSYVYFALQVGCNVIYIDVLSCVRVIVICKRGIVRGGADKSCARPTSRCRRTESIESLERGVCSCAELQVFTCYRG